MVTYLSSVIYILDICSILFQFLAAYLGYRIFNMRKLSMGWLSIVVAFCVQGIRRIFTSVDDARVLFVTDYLLFDRILMFVISLLILIGIYSMFLDYSQTRKN